MGSRSVSGWIERARPALFVCGHIHEAWGCGRVLGVPCINAGALGEPHGQPIAWVVDWQEGPCGIRLLREDGDGRPIEETLAVET